MDNETFGMIVVTIISLLFFFGMGSIVLSFFFDPKEYKVLKSATKNYSPKVISSDYAEILEDEPASVIIDSQDNIPTFDFDGTES